MDNSDPYQRIRELEATLQHHKFNDGLLQNAVKVLMELKDILLLVLSNRDGFDVNDLVDAHLSDLYRLFRRSPKCFDFVEGGIQGQCFERFNDDYEIQNDVQMMDFGAYDDSVDAGVEDGVYDGVENDNQNGNGEFIAVSDGGQEEGDATLPPLSPNQDDIEDDSITSPLRSVIIEEVSFENYNPDFDYSDMEDIPNELPEPIPSTSAASPERQTNQTNVLLIPNQNARAQAKAKKTSKRPFKVNLRYQEKFNKMPKWTIEEMPKARSQSAPAVSANRGKNVSANKNQPKKSSSPFRVVVPKPTTKKAPILKRSQVTEKTSSLRIITLKLTCSECPKPKYLKNETELKSHLLAMHGIRKYRCILSKGKHRTCPDSFESIAEMHQHIKAKHDQTQSTCGQCFKQYGMYVHLREHYRRYHLKGHFQCGLAGCNFTSKNNRAEIRNHLAYFAH